MKRCPRCKESKPTSEYWKRSRAADGLQTYCKPCRREQMAADQRRRREAVRAEINAAKDRPCADCGQSYPPYVMQFDHLSDKAFDIARWNQHTSGVRVAAEIAKCEVVCANCHCERSHRRRA